MAALLPTILLFVKAFANLFVDMLVPALIESSSGIIPLIGASSTETSHCLLRNICEHKEVENIEMVRSWFGDEEIECTKETASFLLKIKAPDVVQYLISRLKDEPPNIKKAYTLYKVIDEITNSCKVGHTRFFHSVPPSSLEYKLIKVYLDALCNLEFNPLLLENLPFDKSFFIRNNEMTLSCKGLMHVFREDLDQLQRHIVELANSRVLDGFDVKTCCLAVTALLALPSFTFAHFLMYVEHGLPLKYVSDLYGNFYLNAIRKDRYDIAYYLFTQGARFRHHYIYPDKFEVSVRYAAMRRAFARLSRLLNASNDENSIYFGTPKDIILHRLFPLLLRLELPEARNDLSRRWCKTDYYLYTEEFMRYVSGR